jgi:hypothetical protein
VNYFDGGDEVAKGETEWDGRHDGVGRSAYTTIWRGQSKM